MWTHSRHSVNAWMYHYLQYRQLPAFFCTVKCLQSCQLERLMSYCLRSRRAWQTDFHLPLCPVTQMLWWASFWGSQGPILLDSLMGFREIRALVSSPENNKIGEIWDTGYLCKARQPVQGKVFTVINISTIFITMRMSSSLEFLYVLPTKGVWLIGTAPPPGLGATSEVAWNATGIESLRKHETRQLGMEMTVGEKVPSGRGRGRSLWSPETFTGPIFELNVNS